MTVSAADLASQVIAQAHARMQQAWLPWLKRKQLPQAALLAGPDYVDKTGFCQRLLASIVCEVATLQPCGQCQHCLWLEQHSHPDVTYLGADHEIIHIEAVRQLQQIIYHAPFGQQRFVVICADRLHVSVANALLKILEEPPAQVCFLLLANAVAVLPLTITSRCQHFVFAEAALGLDEMMLLQSVTVDSGRQVLYARKEVILAQLLDVVTEKVSPCVFVQDFADDAWADVLWFFYFFTAEAIYALGQTKQTSLLYPLALRIGMIRLLTQQRHITQLLNKHRQNITVNATLALEALVIGFFL